MRARDLQKKTKTKKEMKEMDSLGRSEFATAKMGVRVFKDERSYDRNKEKARLRKEIESY